MRAKSQSHKGVQNDPSRENVDFKPFRHDVENHIITIKYC